MEQLGKILIVDDNEDVLFALNLLLEPYAEKIKVAVTPDRIEYFMTTFQPDIILLDMNFSRDAISGQEGFESLEQILRIDPQAVVIFIVNARYLSCARPERGGPARRKRARSGVLFSFFCRPLCRRLYPPPPRHSILVTTPFQNQETC